MPAAGRRWIVLLPLVVLLVPILWSWRGTARHEGIELRTDLTRDRSSADFLAPFVRYDGAWPAGSELVRFARLVERRVPRTGVISTEGVENTTWARALAFAVAPRLVTAGEGSGWAVYRSQAPPTGGTGDVWRVGDYWLVRR